MVEHEETLTCLKCGYALRGLRARKCEDCGHVYLRCPECGVSQIANEAQNRLLLQMRARAARLPQAIQWLQIGFLVAVGVGWVTAGFIAVPSTRHVPQHVDFLGYAILAAPVVLCAALARLLVLQLRNGLLSAAVTVGFIIGSFAVGMVFAAANSPASQLGMFVIAMLVLTGTVVGAAGAVPVGWLLLWFFAKDQDRALLTEGYHSALRGRLFGSGEARASRQLMFCTHCAAELPPLMPGTCSDCGLQQVTCPDCGKRCGVSDALAGMMSVGRITRAARAGVAMAVRLTAMVILWGMIVEATGNNLNPNNGALAGPVAGIFWVPGELLYVARLMLLIAVLTLFIFVRGAIAAALLNAGMVFTAGLLVMAIVRDNGYSSSQIAMMQSAALVLVVEAAGASLLISLLAAIVKAALPRRRVAMLEEVVPELARDTEA